MKKRLQLLLKFTVSGALIWYILSKTDLSGVYESLKSADLFFLIVAFCLLYIGKVLTSYRWQRLLAAQGIHIRLRTLITSIFVGQFFNTFLPTTVGGDAMRAYDTAVYSKEATKSVTTVFADRLIGVLALTFLAFVAIVVGFWIGEDTSFFVLPVLGVFSLCVFGFVLIFNSALATRLEKTLRSLKLTKIAGKVEKAYQSFQVLKENKATLIIAFAVSLALQINVVLFYYFISISLNLGVSPFYFFIIIPVALVVLLIPFSINGIGLREGIFVFLLAKLAVPAEGAVALSWLAFGLILTQGVIGGVLFATRGINIKQLWTNRPTLQKSKVADI